MTPVNTGMADAGTDGFFASVCGSGSLLRAVSDRAFAKARERLHMPALAGLNDLVVRRADEAGLIADAFPVALFGDLYHQRWRIEEAFKRLKHRLHPEAVSGLSQQALIIGVAAKVLADNIASLMCAHSRLARRSSRPLAQVQPVLRSRPHAAPAAPSRAVHRRRARGHL